MKHNNQDDLLLVFNTEPLLVAESVKSKSNDFRDDLEILVNATICCWSLIIPRLKRYKEEEERLKVPHRRLLGSTRSKV